MHTVTGFETQKCVILRQSRRQIRNNSFRFSALGACAKMNQVTAIL